MPMLPPEQSESDENAERRNRGDGEKHAPRNEGEEEIHAFRGHELKY